MDNAEITRLNLGEIKKPPYNILIVTTPRIALLADALKKGLPIKPVIIAKYKGNYYPIGNIDSYMAYKKSGIRNVRCTIEEIDRPEDILRKHVLLETSLSYNVFDAIDATKTLISSGISTSIIPKELRFLAQFRVSKEVRKLFERFILEVSKSHTTVPSMTYILKHINTVEKSEQAKAMKKLIKHAKSLDPKSFTPIDEYKIDSLLEEYIRPYSGEDMVKKGPASSLFKPLENMMGIECPGGCKTQYLINLDTGEVRILEDHGAYWYAGEKDDGMPLYLWKDDIIKNLVGTDPDKILYKYHIRGIDGTPSIIFSERSMPKRILTKFRKILA